jgi:hypothetical protein
MYVSSSKADRLRAHYKEAFEDWALQVNRLHTAIESNPGEAVLISAEERAAAAEIAYRDSRDRLTEEMMTSAENDRRVRE